MSGQMHSLPTSFNVVGIFGLHHGKRHTQTHIAFSLLCEGRQILSQSCLGNQFISAKAAKRPAILRTFLPLSGHLIKRVTGTASMKPSRQEVTAMSQEIGCVFSLGCRIPAIRGSRLSCLVTLHLQTHTISTRAQTYAHPSRHIRKGDRRCSYNIIPRRHTHTQHTHKCRDKHVDPHFHLWGGGLPPLGLFGATFKERLGKSA